VVVRDPVIGAKLERRVHTDTEPVIGAYSRKNQRQVTSYSVRSHGDSSTSVSTRQVAQEVCSRSGPEGDLSIKRAMKTSVSTKASLTSWPGVGHYRGAFRIHLEATSPASSASCLWMCVLCCLSCSQGCAEVSSRLLSQPNQPPLTPDVSSPRTSCPALPSTSLRAPGKVELAISVPSFLELDFLSYESATSLVSNPSKSSQMI